jgi:hypothetical protein
VINWSLPLALQQHGPDPEAGRGVSVSTPARGRERGDPLHLGKGQHHHRRAPPTAADHDAAHEAPARWSRDAQRGTSRMMPFSAREPPPAMPFTALPKERFALYESFLRKAGQPRQIFPGFGAHHAPSRTTYRASKYYDVPTRQRPFVLGSYAICRGLLFAIN